MELDHAEEYVGFDQLAISNHAQTIFKIFVHVCRFLNAANASFECVLQSNSMSPISNHIEFLNIIALRSSSLLRFLRSVFRSTRRSVPDTTLNQPS